MSEAQKALYQVRALGTSAVAAVSGWDSKILDEDVRHVPVCYIYLVDEPTGFMWMAAVPRDEFLRLSMVAFQGSDSFIANVRSACGTLLIAAATERYADFLPDLSWEHQLASSAVLYAGTTQTWAMADRFQNGGHFIVIHYRRAGKFGQLRPFALMNDRDAPLTVEALEQALDEVSIADRTRHPEWFKAS